MNNDLVTIQTFTYAYEAAIFRSKLESEGIFCYLQDELTAQVHPFLSNAIGGVKLQVRKNDVDKAIQLLNEGEAESLSCQESIAEAEEVSSDETEAHITCPFCRSDEIIKTRLSPVVFAVSFLLLGFPLPFLTRRYYCFNCKKKFKYKKS